MEDRAIFKEALKTWDSVGLKLVQSQNINFTPGEISKTAAMPGGGRAH